MRLHGLHEVRHGGGDQDLIHVPPVRVASATFSIEDLTESDDSDDRVIASGAATVDTFSQALTAAAGQGQANSRRASLAVTTNLVVGRMYAIESDAGALECFQAAGVAAAYVDAAAPFGGSYTTAGRVRGLELTATFPELVADDDDFVEDDTPFRVGWTYDVAGRSVTVWEQIRIVRNMAAVRHLAEIEQQLRTTWPGLVKHLSEHPSSLRQFIEPAARRVDARLRTRGLDPETHLAGPQYVELVAQRTVLQFADNGMFPGGVEWSEWRDTQKAEYVLLWDDFKGGGGHDAVRVGQTSDKATENHSPRFRKLWRRA
jgi:hypothetical protein